MGITSSHQGGLDWLLKESQAFGCLTRCSLHHWYSLKEVSRPAARYIACCRSCPVSPFLHFLSSQFVRLRLRRNFIMLFRAWAFQIDQERQIISCRTQARRHSRG